jgi:outer membrane lipoprotein carrier protein
MKKIVLFIAFTIVLVALSFAQASDAKSILDKVSNKLKDNTGITANFSYTTKDKKNVVRGNKKGVIYIKGQKYYLKQGSTEIYSDGSKSWNYNGDKEVTVSEVDEDSKAFTPQKFLSNFYDKDFNYDLLTSTGNYYKIGLTPVDKRKNFKQVTVYVDKTKDLVTKAEITDKADNTTEFTLSNINTNANIPDSRFTFDTKAHPGVEVINE